MSMQVDRKVITGGHIITMDAEYGELPQGALLIEMAGSQRWRKTQRRLVIWMPK
ncbi:MAG: hypothetical protein E7I03_04740 [Serratia liquefaciens]|nr:hypothetical protein [Serratia liquefaciens]